MKVHHDGALIPNDLIAPKYQTRFSVANINDRRFWVFFKICSILKVYLLLQKPCRRCFLLQMISQNVYILQSQFSDDIFFDFWVAVAVNARKGILGNVF
jgi:hypothetical protein